MDKDVYLNENAVKKALNINSFREIDKAKIFQLIQMSGKIDKEVYMKIIEQIPNFVAITKEFTANATQVIEASKTLSKQTKEILNQIACNLNELLKKDTLDKDEKSQLIELLGKIVDIINTCDERDKSHLREILKDILDFGKVAVFAVAAVLGVKFFKGGGKG